MTQERKYRLLARLAEGVPSLVFLSLWRLDADIELAGWLGTALAAAVILGMRLAGRPADTILLGINVHIALITPLITLIFMLGAPATAYGVSDYSWAGVIATIGLTGAGLSALSPRGFVGTEAGPRGMRRALSWVLVGLALAGLGWGLLFLDIPALSFAPPVTVLYLVRRYMVARLRMADARAPEVEASPARA